MRAAKGRIYAFFFVALSLLVSSSALASIPRSTALDPPAFDRYALADEPIASTDVLPLHEQLKRAAVVSWPRESLLETRVGASPIEKSLFAPSTSPLTRALHQAYAHLNCESASDRAFCAGDPVNGRDPTGTEADPGELDPVTPEQAAEMGRGILHFAKSLIHYDEVKEAFTGWSSASGKERAMAVAVAGIVIVDVAGNFVEPGEESVVKVVTSSVSKRITSRAVAKEAEEIAVRKLAEGAERQGQRLVEVNLAQSKKIQPKPEGVRFGKPRGPCVSI